MLCLKLFRVCCVQQPYHILGNQLAGFRSLHTVKMALRENQIMENQQPIMHQNVIVMRHGDRIDNFDPLWTSTAARPWDPPLAQQGQDRAFQMGKSIQQNLGFPIQRLFVSPFLRCIQTATEFVISLTFANDVRENIISDDIPNDLSNVKVSIEYGLCEMFNSIAIRLNVAPKDGNFSFDISELEAMLPAGTVDNNVEMVYKELPKWEESVLQARARYQHTIEKLADKYPTKNLLFITHGEGIEVALSSFRKDIVVNKVQYCGYVQLSRPIFKRDHTLIGGKFNVLTHSGQSGVTYIPSQGL
ncbi:Phosphoglycerate mutase family protein [Trifolium repens]|nr:Phosphoglycerate mutase family protein [Trifolium repens]